MSIDRASNGDEPGLAAGRGEPGGDDMVLHTLGPRRERFGTTAARVLDTATRGHVAVYRDENARARDLGALARDRIADAADQVAEARERALEGRMRVLAAEADDKAWEEMVDEVRAARLFARRQRARAAADRAAAWTDRKQAAEDRRQAALDRHHAGFDELTGVLRRGTGEIALQHELDRARRAQRPLVVAMIDVDGLKAVNDHAGHAQGDALLRDVAEMIAATLRSYDVLLRWGGDEFVCALSDMTLEAGPARVEQMRTELGARRPDASISVGLAEVEPDDMLETLMARADAALYEAKAARPARSSR